MKEDEDFNAKTTPMERFKLIRRKLYDGEKVEERDFQFALLYLLGRMNKSIEELKGSGQLAQAITGLVNALAKKSEGQPAS